MINIQQYIDMQKQIMNTWKMIIKTKHHHISKKKLHHNRCKKFVWMGNVLKLPADGFKWEKKILLSLMKAS